ncbi:ImmA/IrrE family metallo-endopeptidase [Streptacidiphilus sp. EB103A]|uniref:ImmA/IrrE family metallo-endopeptidase n=1 Tax=Streptacidiphilus sp. EB103A TaxID=3156275 RepID=UPI003518A9BB
MSATDTLGMTWEWESALGVKLPEHRCTWARLEIRAGGEVVTLVEDLDSGSSRRSIYVPLYPLAEWVAFNWWTLLYNSRLSSSALMDNVRLSSPEHMRNNFRSIGDGFSWPDLAIIPAGSQTTISWRPFSSPIAGWRLRYIGRGDVLVATSVLRDELARFVEAVIARLDENGISNTALHKEWQEVSGTDSDEAEYCRTAARLGLDPYSTAHEFEEEILSAAELVPDSLFGDFVDAVAPAKLRAAQKWIAKASAKAEAMRTPSNSALEAIHSALDGSKIEYSSRPWETGWSQAKIARQAAQVPSGERFAINEYVTVGSLASPELQVQALGIGRDQAVSLVLGSHHANSRSSKFLLGRALWHSAATSDTAFLVTNAYTEKQKIERAFAAELLAPAAGIAQLLEHDAWSTSLEEVERIADHFDVSAILVQHQIDNQLVAA